MRSKEQETTVASDANRDFRKQPFLRPPRVPEPPLKWAPRRAWERMLASGRVHPVTFSIRSLARSHRLRLPKPGKNALREPVKQFRGLGVAVLATGIASGVTLWWFFGLRGAAIGVVLAVACFAVGRAKSKPWRCANCKTLLPTAKVRVCPGCGARLVDADAVKVLPASEPAC